MNQRVLKIKKDLQEVVWGEPWFGECLMEKLNRFSEERFFQKPFGKLHSVAEQLSHMTFWRKEVIKSIKNPYWEGHGMDSPENWIDNDLLKEKGKKSLIKDFLHSQQELDLLLDEKDDQFLDTAYRENTFEFIVRGIIQHDIYHIGQIGLTEAYI
jgi:uncharacterized damage-inducible protein DinB